ncbi:hypothetical protein BD289DRAFT_505765 [Coniella lustricola]|uniref:Chromosome segregation ATPase family protein n=1 Tax=Coniella lustricola TaxID=2025994 RepID=A0A2T3A956_9PEZI|nr:hypothetical protein BD289DRAFT_505765 [Coniella lustricola]
MPPVERDAPASYAERPSSRHSRHSTQSMSFDAGRALVPMWDSSDPERAPPPLPLNPQSPGTATSRAGTSSAIQLAHAALTEKARENALVPHPLTKRATDVSPERLLSKGAAHRRLQSLQPGSLRDMNLMLEGPQLCKSPEKTDRELPKTPSRSKTDPFNDARADEQDQEQRLSLTPMGANLTQVIRPTPRRPQSSILGENTPPQSATMLALQNMPQPVLKRDNDTPLVNVTNGSTGPMRDARSIEQISGQILTLTNIATSLQKEMSQLSRRSRDNATDLLSLKEATTSRDEDIRKNMRDLLHNMQEVSSRTASSGSRDMYGGPLLLDNKPFGSTSLSPSATNRTNGRPFALPRIPSPNSFAASLDREDLSTPSLSGTEASATVGLLERIIRDMGTKDGQDQLLSRLSELARRLDGYNVEQKVEDLQRLIKTNMEQQSLVLTDGGSGGGGGKIGLPRNQSFSDDPDDYRNGSLGGRGDRLIQDQDMRNAAPTARAAADLISDDIVKIIRTVKDSVAQGGGLTAEVKALVRELRGEVLGMGREIGRKLDDVAETSQTKTAATTKRDMTKIVEDGLAQVMDHMNQLTRDHLRQSAATIAANRTPEVDYHEIYNALRTALKDSKVFEKDVPDLQREDVIEAVKDAWENYKPEIEVQQIGLERHEVLDCLREGLMEYAPKDDKDPAATKEEVFMAVVEGLKHFSPPPIEVPATLSRDEIIEAVRDCLEEFEFPVAPSAMGDLSKQDLIDAIQQGLEDHDRTTKDAASLVPYQVTSEEVMSRLHDIMEYMQSEFKAVSTEAKQNVAANGRDTEQVLDATKDGFERLRADIEGYVDRASGVATQDEFMDELLKSLDVFRDEIAEMVSKQTDGSKHIIREELESLRHVVNSSLVPASAQPVSGSHEEILNALHEGIGSLRHEISQRPVAGTREVLDALQEGLSDLRLSIDKMNDRPADSSANDEILDALRAGLDGVKSDIEGLREDSKALTPLTSGAIIAGDMLRHEDIKNLEGLISQLRTKVEDMEANSAPPAAVPDSGSSLSKDDVLLMEDMLHQIKEQVSELAGKEPAASTATDARAPGDSATKEDVEAIETILRNTKARLDELLDAEQAVRKDQIDALEVLILETKESLGGLTEQLEQLAHREDTQAVESLVTQVVGAFDEMKERHEKQLEDPEKVTKTDTDAIEAVCLEVKGVVEQMVKSDIAALPTKEDLDKLESLVNEFKDISEKQTAELKEATVNHVTELKEAAEKHAAEFRELSEQHAEANAKQFEERQAETVGVGEHVTEVKVFLAEMQNLIKDKLEHGITGVEGLSKSLEALGETVGLNANVHSDLKEMFEAVKTEFEESKAGVVGAKLETDEKFEHTTETLRTKIDERIDEVIAKYDELQTTLDERNKTGETRDEVIEGAVLGTKAVAEELKSLIDTLGSTVTESLEKMEEASKTVFSQVEDMVSKTDDNHTHNKSEHAQTRDQVKEAMSTFEGLHGQINEYQPKILEAVQSVLETVGQHFEHSKASISEIEEKIGQRIDDAKPEPLMLPPPPEKYDDSNVHEKLDRLVDHTQSADRAFEQLSTLDKVHQQVMATAAELAAFLATQTQRIADEHEDREKTLQDVEANLQETKLELERRTVERDHAEATVAGLQAEEERLRQSIVTLKVEQESLVRQKIGLTGDVSSLETALNIRREELHEMEQRAEGLERRILEGVMDQSRLLLMAKSTKKTARDVMSRKRVSPQKPMAEEEEQLDSKQRTPKAHHTVAVKTALNANRNGLNPQPVFGPNGQQQVRRILSLSQIKNSSPNSPVTTGAGFKRSQSVKTLGGVGAYRKSSWAGRMHGAKKKGYGDLHHGSEGDKENVNLDVVALRESDEDELNEPGPELHGGEIVLATPTDSVAYSEGITPTESIGYSEGITPTESIDYSEGITPTESIGYSEGITPTESIGYSEGITPTESVGYTESFAPTESMVDTESIAPSEGTIPEDAREDDYYDTYSEAHSEAGTLRRSSLNSGTGTITGSEYTHSDVQSRIYPPSEEEEDDDDDRYSDTGSNWTESVVSSAMNAGTASDVSSGLGHATSDGGITSSEGSEVMLYE